MRGVTSVKEPATMKDKIYNRIMEDILSHQYSDREVINEKDLVEKYGCSKTPIREALISLCNENVLRSIPRYGYEVVRLSTDDVMNMLQYRFAVESGVILPGLKRFGKNQITALREIDKACRETGDVWEHWDLNSAFHIRMLVFAGNPFAGSRVESCINELKRAYAQFCWDNATPVPLADDIKHHQDILKALESHDEELLMKSLRADVYDFAANQLEQSW